MRMIRVTFIIGFHIFAMHLPVHATNQTFEYFDLKTCTYESITDLIPDPIDTAENSPVRQRARGRGILEIGSIPRCYGFCDYASGKSVSCSLDSCERFPLRGATFKLIYGKSPLPSFRCVKGCGEGVPAVLHDTGYEPTEDEYNTLWTETYLKFQRVCKKKR